jgi:hypothetical protein
MTRIRIEDLPALEELTAEELAEILGAGRNSFRPAFEALEKREMLDAGLPSVLAAPLVEFNLQGHHASWEAANRQAGVTHDAAVRQAAQHRFINAPYIDLGWDNALAQMRDAMKRGVRFFNLAFVGVKDAAGHLSFGGHLATEGTFANDLKKLITELRGMGGDVRLSFGGAKSCNDGTEPAQWFQNQVKEGKMTQAQALDGLTRMYRSVIQFYGVKSVDFDIEGSALADYSKASWGLRASAIKNLQNELKLEVVFTLSALPDHPGGTKGGLPKGALDMLAEAKNAGVNIAQVNIMAMDYGPWWVAGRSLGQCAISAANATFAQLKNMFGKSDADTWKMIGITVNIGQNEAGTGFFTLKDAQDVVAFANAHQVGMISFWSYNKDGDHKYWEEFKKYEGAGMPGMALEAGQALAVAKFQATTDAASAASTQTPSPVHASLDHYYSHVAAEALLNGNDRSFAW